MKKTFKFFAAALAIVAAASCAKEVNDNIQNENPAEETIHMTISASFDSEGETKTVLAGNTFVHWTDEDAIKLFYAVGEWWYLNDGVFAIDPNSNDADPTFAVFSGETKPSKKYYAVSPASGWSAPSESYFQFEGLHYQNAVENSFDPTKHLAMSVSTSGDVFKFQNVCALLKVKVIGDGAYSFKVEGQSDGYGIGQAVRFRPGNLEVYKLNYGGDSAITLSNANSTPLENGASYYIVVPHVTVNNFKVSLCDANGNALVTKSKASDFKIERNKIYDLGTFERPKESVEVNTSSLSLAAKNASASFKVVADVDWTVTSSASWLTVSPSSGAATSGTTINVTASENTTDYARTATLTIKGKTLTRTVSVTQAKRKTYRVGNRVTKTVNLVGDHNYIVKLHYSEYEVWTNSGDHLALSSPYTYTEEHVFTFLVAGTPSDPSGYSSDKSGWFMSLKTGKLIDANLDITVTENNLSNVQTFYLGSQWGSETGSDFDIYKNGTSETLYRSGTWMGWTTAGGNNENRKWAIYEAIEN